MCRKEGESSYFFAGRHGIPRIVKSACVYGGFSRLAGGVLTSPLGHCQLTWGALSAGAIIKSGLWAQVMPRLVH